MRFLLPLLLLTALGCGKPKRVEPLRVLSDDWKAVHIKGAEQAWVVPEEGSSLLIDSQCDPKNHDIPLNALTVQLLIGMTDQTLVEQHPVSFQDREALISTYSLKVDGAFRKMHILVLKKEGCVFDVVLTCPESVYAQRLADFEKVQQLFTLVPGKK